MKLVYLIYSQKEENPIAVCLTQKAVTEYMHTVWTDNPSADIWWDEVEAHG